MWILYLNLQSDEFKGDMGDLMQFPFPSSASLIRPSKGRNDFRRQLKNLSLSSMRSIMHGLKAPLSTFAVVKMNQILAFDNFIFILYILHTCTLSMRQQLSFYKWELSLQLIAVCTYWRFQPPTRALQSKQKPRISHLRSAPILSAWGLIDLWL